MSIDPCNEELKTFGQAARMLPRRRGGRPVHPTTLWRWFRYGVVHGGGRVYLEAIKTPSGMATTTEALQRFLSRLNHIEPTTASPPRQNTVNTAVAQLDADGV